MSPFSRRLLVLLLVLAVCPYFVDLGGSSIWDANEAFYVETPREMMERGDYVSPTFNYEPRFNKPVLSYWIVAGFYHLFGVSVGVQRLPIALAAVVLVATAFALAWIAAPGAASPRAEPRSAPAGPATPGAVSREGPSVPTGSAVRLSGPGLRALVGTPAAWDAALWAALGLAIGPRLLMFARRIFIDMYITMFMALTLLFFALAERFPARRRTFLPLMYVAAGLGALTKGPVAIVLPAAVFGLYLIVHRELGRLRSMMLPAGALIVLAITLPWYAALYERHGWTYIVSFLVGENIGRYTEGIGDTGQRGPFFYVPVVFSDSFPWSLLIVPAAWHWFDQRRIVAPRGDARFRIRTLLWLWILVIVGFFSFSQTKQDLYVFPIVVAIAALGGVFAASAGDARARAWLTGTAAVIGGLLTATGGLGFFWLRDLYVTYGVDGLMPACGVALAGGLAMLGAARAAKPLAALAVMAATLVAVNWILVLRVLPSVEPYKPSPFFSETLQRVLTPVDAVIHYQVAMPSMVYYLRRHVEVYYEKPEFLAALSQPRGTYVVLSAEDYDEVVRESGVETCILARRATFEARLRDLAARRPLPELLLISTVCR